ncbi:MAG: PAS domain S-box protein [Deltaproteobacteria bacterium]|nr:PAS domain S-box protein [Deltaproteobacteria bacterium]
MSLLAWAAMASSVAFALLLQIAFSRRAQGSSSRVFLLFCLAGLSLSLLDLGLQTAVSARAANVWARVQSCWPFLPALLFHFALVYSGIRPTRWRRLGLLVLYAIVLALTLIGLTTRQVTAGVEREAWGWTHVRPLNTATLLATVFGASVGLATVIIVFRHSVRSRGEPNRHQTRHVAIAAAIPVLTGLLTDGVLPLLGLRLPSLATVSAFFCALLLGSAIRSHGLFSLSPTLAAESIVAAISDALLLVSPAGTIQRANPAAARLLGAEERELLGQRIEAFIPPDDLPAVSGSGPAPGATPARVEVTARSRSGVRLPVAVSRTPVAAPDGTPIGTAVSMQNLTEIEQAHEMALMLDRAIATTRTGVTIRDRNGQIVYSNPADVAMHGYASLDELIGQPARVFGPPEAAAPLSVAEVESMDGLVREGLNVRKDGSVFPVRLVSDIVRSKAGRVIGVITVCEDISQRRQAEEEVRRAHEQLRATSGALIQAEKLAALGELAATVAHEINQPLNAIKISCQASLRALQRGETGPGEQDLREIADLVNRAAEVVDQVRRFVRRAEGAVVGHVDINAVVTAATALVARQLEDRHIELVQDLAAGLPGVIGDAVSLEQVLLNLIVNAKDALESGRPERRRIEVRTHRGAADRPDGGAAVVIEVADTGPGIPEHLHQEVFTPFFTTKKAGKGTGLGLAIVQRIVDQHHGKIQVHSVLGRGTRFEITLPGVAALAEAGQASS